MEKIFFFTNHVVQCFEMPENSSITFTCLFAMQKYHLPAKKLRTKNVKSFNARIWINVIAALKTSFQYMTNQANDFISTSHYAQRENDYGSASCFL